MLSIGKGSPAQQLFLRKSAVSSVAVLSAMHAGAAHAKPKKPTDRTRKILEVRM